MSFAPPAVQSELFLSTYAETGNLLAARKASGISTTQLRSLMAEQDTDFALQLQQAKEDFGYVLEAEAFRRAVTGYEKNVYSKGELVGTDTVYSDPLLIKLLEANVDRYSKKVEVAHTGGFSVEITQFSNTVPMAEPLETVEDVTPKEETLW
jgi:hypothetical protein